MGQAIKLRREGFHCKTQTNDSFSVEKNTCIPQKPMQYLPSHPMQGHLTFSPLMHTP